MVLLPRTPPYDWAWMVGFLQARAVAGVERFHDGATAAALAWKATAADSSDAGRRGAGPAGEPFPGLQPVAEICYARIGQLFDLACDRGRSPGRWALWPRRGRGCACRGAGCLRAGGARGAGPAGERGDGRPAHRQSGGWLGRTAGGGARICLVPDARGPVRADPQALKALGMPLRRAEALIHLARAALSGELPLTAPADIDAGLRQLQTLPGIGRWTANYFALRGWQAKDIFCRMIT